MKIPQSKTRQLVGWKKEARCLFKAVSAIGLEVEWILFVGYFTVAVGQ